ncbi:hypothetical protein AMBR_BLFENHAL_02050 [Lacticaseibacillus rhamnosus]|nr:hypothetical protein AMBR_BLFENHAL_02050 [Lacticaseibacillus rhamnosus]
MTATVIFDLDGTLVNTEAPVSYTHLRAHETVLDLVCRLLLEKKKNMKMSSFDHQVIELHPVNLTYT